MNDIDLAVISKYGGLYFSEKGEAINEQRLTFRHRLRKDVNIAFYNNGELHRGYMSDLSIRGACLILPAGNTERLPFLSISRKMECYVLNKHGSSKCRGTVRWTRRDGKLLRWGISFIELSDREDDPLRRFIAEVCRVNVSIPVTGTAVY